MLIRSAIAAGALLGVTTVASAQPTVLLVRHAERADTAPGVAVTMATDPDLSEVGRQRAEALAVVLDEAAVSAIFVTEFKRTQQTATPLAKTAALTPVPVPAKDIKTLVERIKSAAGTVLVVGHSNTVPEIIKALGGAAPTIADDEFDNLFVVMPGAAGQPPAVLRLRYR